jgi:hypothetical protein
MPKLGCKPADIPAKPDNTYAKKGWKGYGDWLGTWRIANHRKNYRSFRKARTFARQLKLKSCTEWFAFCKGEMPRKGRLPADIPANPGSTYSGKGWKGYSDLLGNRGKKQSKGLVKNLRRGAIHTALR